MCVHAHIHTHIYTHTHTHHILGLKSHCIPPICFLQIDCHWWWNFYTSQLGEMFEITSNTGSHNMKKVNNAVKFIVWLFLGLYFHCCKNLEVRISGKLVLCPNLSTFLGTTPCYLGLKVFHHVHYLLSHFPFLYSCPITFSTIAFPLCPMYSLS